MRICLFCPAKASSQEHVIPAALGGNDTVAATCVGCNQQFGKFEDEFTDRLLPFRQIAAIPNRRAKIVPSAPAMVQFGAVEERGGRHPDGEISVRNRQLDAAGDVLSENLRTTSLKEVQEFKRRARQQGKKVVEQPGEWVDYTTVFSGDFHFLIAPPAMRSAAKASYMSLVRQSRTLARSKAFDAIRSYILNCTGNPVRLFFNLAFAKSLGLAIHEHQIIIVLDGRTGTAQGIVVFLGGLQYIVDLSNSYHGADYEFTYRVNALNGISSVTNRNERQLLRDVRNGDTKWNEIAFSGGYFGSLVPKSNEYQFSLKRL